MTEKILPSLEGVSQTLPMTLYVRARETQRADGMVRDEQAVSMVNRWDATFHDSGCRGMMRSPSSFLKMAGWEM